MYDVFVCAKSSAHMFQFTGCSLAGRGSVLDIASLICRSIAGILEGTYK